MTTRKSLLGEAAAQSTDGPTLDAARVALRTRLDNALADFRAGKSRDAKDFSRYCARVAKAAQEADWPEGFGGLRQALVGAYIEAAATGKRRAGHQPMGHEGFFLHAWHTINLARAEKGLPLLVGSVPAKAIAQWCAQFGVPTTPRQVSDALRQEKRTLPCPYYGSNTEN